MQMHCIPLVKMEPNKNVKIFENFLKSSPIEMKWKEIEGKVR